MHAKLFRGICIKSQINEQTYAKIINLICAGSKVFVQYQAQGGEINPNPPPFAYALDSEVFGLGEEGQGFVVEVDLAHV